MRLARDAGARTYVDAVAATPHRRVDRQGWGADAVVCSAYKWYGPHVGVLSADPALLAELHPDKLVPSPDTVPDGGSSAPSPSSSSQGCGPRPGSCSTSRPARLGRGAGPRRQARRRPAGDRRGDRARRAPAGRRPDSWFTVAGLEPDDVARRLAARRIAVWSGTNYAWEIAHWLGLGDAGAVRAGLVHYNDARDVDRFLDALAGIVG